MIKLYIDWGGLNHDFRASMIPLDPPLTQLRAILLYVIHIIFVPYLQSRAYQRGERAPLPLGPENTIFPGFLPLNYANLHLKFVCFLLCRRTEKACRMIKKVVRLIFRALLATTYDKISRPPWENPECAPVHRRWNGGRHRSTVPPLKCEILTLTPWALHGKNELKSRWCPPWSEPFRRQCPCLQWMFRCVILLIRELYTITDTCYAL